MDMDWAQEAGIEPMQTEQMQTEQGQAQQELPALPQELENDRRLALTLRDAFDGKNDAEIVKELASQKAREQAEQLGLSPQAVQALREGDMQAFARGLLEQEEAVRQQYPEFELEQALSDGLVRMLVASGAPLARVAEFVMMPSRIEQAKEQAKAEVIASIRARNARPSPVAPGAEAGGGALTDQEVRRIDERLKRGERVML